MYVARTFSWIQPPSTTITMDETREVKPNQQKLNKRIQTLIGIMKYLLGLHINEQIPSFMRSDYRIFKDHVVKLRNHRVTETIKWKSDKQRRTLNGQSHSGWRGNE